MKVLLAVLALSWAGCTDNGGQNDGGGDAPSDGPQQNDGGGSDATTDADVVVPPTCNVTMQWQAGTKVSLSTTQPDLFGAITPDELTIAWMTAAGKVLYADRAKATDAFGAPQTLTAGIALDRVALSPDGLTMIVVPTNRNTLAQTTRGSRGSVFSSTLDLAPFASLDPLSQEGDAGTTPSHGSFADPMLSEDGQFLYYSQTGIFTLTMCESYRKTGDTSPWGQGRNLQEAQLSAPDTSGVHMIPTGMSSDGLTLFFWDGVAKTERAAFRDNALTNNTYKQFLTLGATYRNAAPVGSCGRIYFCDGPGSGDGGADLDLFFADTK
jgi:hypothetical protein